MPALIPNVAVLPGHPGPTGGLAVDEGRPEEVEMQRRVDRLRRLRVPLQDLGTTPDLPALVGLATNCF